MESKRLWAAALFFCAICAWAQSPSVAASCNTGWNWNQNSLGQDPCHVASILQAACRNGSDTNGPQSLNGSFYTPPQVGRLDGLKCECDTVTYRWIEWAHECNTTHVAQYPFDIPNGTAIPRWAFYNITGTQKRHLNKLAVSVKGEKLYTRPCRGGRRKLPRRQETLEHIREQQTSPNLEPNPTELTTCPPPAYEAPKPPPTYVDTERLHGQGSGLQSGTPAFPPPTYDTSNPPTHVDTGTLHGQSCRLNPGTSGV
ncbi:hypothetical protein BJ322DRAFT_1169784 [Thelephora terrestris]|uniref:Uncharacterized protein n=1 Tax=Thelephora terrestris TaxID=56493 RepID=A0A9P6HNZ0_9AGAM|nr:hypothetical protein BJ322DRAFT_1169784 [Thelephora terrestris]